MKCLIALKTSVASSTPGMTILKKKLFDWLNLSLAFRLDSSDIIVGALIFILKKKEKLGIESIRAFVNLALGF